jgi:hypothetical protein
MEKDSGFNELRAIAVCNAVIRSKGVPIEGKAEFHTKKGQIYRGLAVQGFAVDPEKSIMHLVEAVSSFLESIKLYQTLSLDHERFAKTRDSLRDTFRFLFICAARSLSAQRRDLIDLIFKFFSNEAKRKGYFFDLIEGPAIDCIRILSSARTNDDLTRNRAFIQRVQGVLDSRAGLTFRDEKIRNNILSAAGESVRQINALTR